MLLTPEEAAAFREDLIRRGFIKVAGTAKKLVFIKGRETVAGFLSNVLQSTHDVHAPVVQENGTRPLAPLATQWRNDFAKRSANHS